MSSPADANTKLRQNADIMTNDISHFSLDTTKISRNGDLERRVTTVCSTHC